MTPLHHFLPASAPGSNGDILSSRGRVQQLAFIGFSVNGLILVGLACLLVPGIVGAMRGVRWP
jgi:hypothetical protein